MRWIDLPPLWLFAALGVTWLSPWQVPWGQAFWPGIIFILLAVGLTLAALHAFSRARTTVIPRQEPSALITGGIFRLTRNPIYLADVLILIGFTLIWGKLFGFVLVPAFTALLDHRFIRGEEAKLRETFGSAFEDYADRTRRWI